MGSFGIMHWLVVLAVLILLFGTKKLRNLGGDLGAAVKGFKDGVKGDDEKNASQQKALSANGESIDRGALDADADRRS